MKTTEAINRTSLGQKGPAEFKGGKISGQNSISVIIAGIILLTSLATVFAGCKKTESTT